MAPEQTNAKRHGPNRATTVICLVLILAAALVIARMVKFRSQVDVTLPAVLWEDGEATPVKTTLPFHRQLTMAHEGGGLNRGLLEYGKFPAHTFFGELYTDREYTQFFLFPFERVPGKIEGTVSYQPDTSVYVAPAVSLDEAKALLESYGLMESHGLPIPDESLQ